MYFANPKSSTKLFHAIDCGYLRNKDNCITFNDEQEAHSNGYIQCNKCATLTKKYINGNRKIISELCNKYNLSVKFYDGKAFVYKGESGWIILVNLNDKLRLYHRNEKSPHKIIQTDMSCYHRQKRSFSNIEEVLRYILHHESIDFQEKLALQNVNKYAPHNRRERNKRKKSVKRKFGISRTMKLLKELEKQ